MVRCSSAFALMLLLAPAASHAASPGRDGTASAVADPDLPAMAKQPLDEGNWMALVSDGKPTGFVEIDRTITLCGDVRLRSDSRDLAAEPGTGVVAALTQLGYGERNNLVGNKPFGDCEVYLEFLLGKGSNSGVKLQQRYEIQLYDSHGKDEPSATDCGGIYPHWVFRRRGGGIRYIDEGVPPAVNAAKPAGQWQTLHIVFRAPRFDGRGEKTDNARFALVTLNGKVVHRDVDVDSPTGNASDPLPEVARAPLYLQMDHGPVAFRNVHVKLLDE